MKELEDVLKTNHRIPLHKKAILNVFLTYNGLRDAMQNILKPFDLSVEQFNVLRILRGAKSKPVSLNYIQERMVSKMSNTTRLVDKLILKGYVERFVCEKNRRKVDIYITRTGLDVLEQLDTVVDDSEYRITSNLSDQELEQLNLLLNKLR